MEVVICVAVFARVKVTLVDTIVRVEHLPCDATTGTALEVHIKRMEYFDDTVTQQQSQQAEQTYEPPAVAIKNIRVYGLEFFCEEFQASSRTKARMSEVSY